MSILLVALGCGRVEEDPAIIGRVIALDGRPVRGASVAGPRGSTSTDADGWFRVGARPGAQWVTVQHPQFLSRTRAANPSAPVLVRLTPDDGETIALHFGGDVMFGRRFYDPNEDGNTADGLLRPGSSAAEHLALLEHIRPLLENSHVTAVNLETPLADSPYADPTRPRPPRFHPTKAYAFASAPGAALALREAGVDVIDLGNNHLYDLLDVGVESTRAALARAGFRPGIGFFGAGSSAAEAWEPAYVRVRGQTLAFIGCTTITGGEHAITYVASAEKGGAARCEVGALRDAVARARARATIIVMIHGGYEYARVPSPGIRRLTEAAREAGAALVVNHHPHVVGGLEWTGSSLVAWTLGNLLFDQTVWPTFESYLLAVHLRRGEVIRAYIEPLIIESFIPKAVTGGLADYVARGAAGFAGGPFVVEDGAMEVDVHQRARQQRRGFAINGGDGSGRISRLGHGWWLSAYTGTGTVRLGRDLLWVGSFEPHEVAAEDRGTLLWNLEGSDRQVGREFAYRGGGGARIERSSNRRADAVLTHLHRILIEPLTELSVIGMVRATVGQGPLRGKADVTVQLSWYADTNGPSVVQATVPLQIASDGEWQPFRVDVTAPPVARAVGVFLRLAPPQRGAATADFDDLRIIEWAPRNARFSPQYDHFLVTGSGRATVSKSHLPGAERWPLLPPPD